ncbi:putative F-box protein At1g58090 [Eutrema salsugineum]|uniref:putative F-box protein At1g58090 n=1 Tax=Eutrema salsugineum TaxID=72664 RepID=UPI000CED24F3|nr:putative F-box protein At1g58090 [Eutrema salsugineum]
MPRLPSDIEVEILTRVPTLSVARFRSVCKEWNAIFNDMKFMLQTDSKIYSISINLKDDEPNIKVRELTTSFDFPVLATANCDGFIFLFDYFTKMDKGAVWNPCLRQATWIEVKPKQLYYTLCGMGYDSSGSGKSYKIVGLTYNVNKLSFAIYEFATKWKFIDDDEYNGEPGTQQSLSYNNLSLNGNLHVLAVFKGDRFSLLEQCDLTLKTEIWVTEKKITNVEVGDAVVWIKFMSISIPNFTWSYECTSYFVDVNVYRKCFVMCCSDRDRQACVYIVRGDKWRKIKTDDVIGGLHHCSVYVSSLIPTP